MGSLVLLKTGNTAVFIWKLGRVVKLYLDSDEIILMVDIKTDNDVIR